uniref:NADH dehydrogenase subunit 6 n=1 Tax=Dreissena rostriformis TaxID=205083 RepID=A0A894JLD4_9BIVA|nr:NADH dehydrogenase subunit 6 [Dreissena rostriformis]QRV59737.1 NADH dehydrogenase subunit 6 [Dreissena rostriformis]
MTFTIYSVLFTLLIMIVYTSITATAVITAISMMLAMFLLCTLFLLLKGSSFASFILYISAIAGISVLLSYCLTMMPKISTAVGKTSKRSKDKTLMMKNSKMVEAMESTPPKNLFKMMLLALLSCPLMVVFFYLTPSMEKEDWLSIMTKKLISISKPDLLPMTEAIISNHFWSFTSMFLTVVLFILMISSLKMISSLSGVMGPDHKSNQ